MEFSGRDLKDDSFRGEPAAGMRVLVEGGGRRHETLTDARGDFAFKGLPPGSYSVRQLYPEHARGYVDPTPFELRARQCREVGYRPWWDGRIRGRVVDLDGRPLAGLRVWLISPELDVSVRANLMHSMWVVTEADGSFELTNVPRGRYQLVVNLTGDADDNPYGYRACSTRASKTTRGRPSSNSAAARGWPCRTSGWREAIRRPDKRRVRPRTPRECLDESSPVSYFKVHLRCDC